MFQSLGGGCSWYFLQMGIELLGRKIVEFSVFIIRLGIVARLFVGCEVFP